MLESVSECPICNSNKFVQVRQCKDYLVTHEMFSIVQCETCHFTLTSPRPDKNTIVSYYKSDSYISHANKSNSPINFLYKLVRTYTLRKKLRILDRYTLKGSLLDYGCGTGHFLSYANTKGWNTKGVEPDPNANQQAKQLVGSTLVFEDLESFGQEQFNAITMFHVLEHIHDLSNTFEALSKLLKPQGIMLVAVPNHKSYDAQHYQSDWAAYDLPRHLYHFDSRSISQLSDNIGLKVVAQLPMRFDSYYVSLLSENNKRSSLSSVRGFFQGFISNYKAKSTKEYSSLLYVLQKK